MRGAAAAQADTLAAVPKLSRESLDKMHTDSVQDILLVMFLSTITRTQLTLSDKLATMSLML